MWTDLSIVPTNHKSHGHTVKQRSYGQIETVVTMQALAPVKLPNEKVKCPP